jgi:hypothetical protein
MGGIFSMNESVNAKKNLSENLKRREHLGNLVVDMSIILKMTLKKYDARICIGFIWLRLGRVARSCEHGNASSGCIKVGEFRG